MAPLADPGDVPYDIPHGVDGGVDDDLAAAGLLDVSAVARRAPTRLFSAAIATGETVEQDEPGEGGDQADDGLAVRRAQVVDQPVALTAELHERLGREVVLVLDGAPLGRGEGGRGDRHRLVLLPAQMGQEHHLQPFERGEQRRPPAVGVVRPIARGSVLHLRHRHGDRLVVGAHGVQQRGRVGPALSDHRVEAGVLGRVVVVTGTSSSTRGARRWPNVADLRAGDCGEHGDGAVQVAAQRLVGDAHHRGVRWCIGFDGHGRASLGRQRGRTRSSVSATHASYWSRVQSDSSTSSRYSSGLTIAQIPSRSVAVGFRPTISPMAASTSRRWRSRVARSTSAIWASLDSGFADHLAKAAVRPWTTVRR